MSISVLTHISSKIQEEISSLTDTLASGAAKDYAEYRATCGIIRGLMKANGVIVEVAEKLENSDD